ncbi:MAG: hypothetical protein KF858_05120 [Candidatus Sumerlaeia bacterium]|nr:hypothetical protein [Candidatus Sumerlaeia bacterium]
MEKDVKTKKLQTNIPEPLFDRIKARAERLWGENDSESNVVATALRDWMSQSERGGLDARLDQMERRIEYLLTTRPAEGFRDDRPTLDDPQVQRRLGLTDPLPISTGVPKLPNKPDPKEVAEMGVELLQNHRRTKCSYGLIGPEYLLGYDPAGRVDFANYESAGFPLLRDPKSYNLEDSTMKQIFESYCVKPIYAPLLIYYYGKKIVVLDGLARFAAMLEAWRQSRCGMTRVPVELFIGEEDLAGKERIIRNLHGGPRSLTRAEFERAVDRLNGLG